MTEASTNSETIDRLSIRTRPAGRPAIYQWWGKLLFIHWSIPVEALRPLIPEQLEIDTFEGKAWIGVVPFTMWGIRPKFIPMIPVLSRAHELNVRTYVHYKGEPGVWFLSLDINQTLGMLVGRYIFHLPYVKAKIQLAQNDKTINYDLVRSPRKSPAEFSSTWTIGDELPQSTPGTLEFFLTERYCLYCASGRNIYQCRIYHQPWPLRDASLSHLRSTMIESHGLNTPETEPLIHYAESLKVGIWPLCKV